MVRRGCDSHSIMPPWSPTIFATKARPRPLPVGFVVTNGSKRCGKRSSGTPGPLSRTQNSSGSETLVLLPGSAVGQQKPLKDQIVGTWSLVSAIIEKDGKKTDGLGPNPMGYMMFDSSGHFVYDFMRSDTPKFASNNRETGTPDENKAAVQGNISSFGTYTINPDGSVTFHIIGSSFPNWKGTDQKRLIEIGGEQLKYTNPSASVGGSAVNMLARAK